MADGIVGAGAWLQIPDFSSGPTADPQAGVGPRMVKKPAPWVEQMRTASTRVAPLAFRSAAQEPNGTEHPPTIAAQAADPVRNTHIVAPSVLAHADHALTG